MYRIYYYIYRMYLSEKGSDRHVLFHSLDTFGSLLARAVVGLEVMRTKSE